jgi:hypothetical protein
VLAMPGTTTVGRPRQSSVNGLPKGALNISIDGINVQDNLLKSNDGFFTYVRPRTDAISEVTVSTSTPGAESSSKVLFKSSSLRRADRTSITVAFIGITATRPSMPTIGLIIATSHPIGNS